MITVREHQRREPQKPEDPFANLMQSRRARFAAKWRLQLTDTSDTRLSQPVPAPTHGGRTMAAIVDGLHRLAEVMKRIG